jgi:manganese/zinc/iron transport system ATP- binding protein
MNNKVIMIEDLTVAYDEKPVLWDVDLEIPEGVLAAIVGPNGAGKSTLLKSALGLVPSTAGQVKAFNTTVEKARHRIGYVPQRTAVDWDFPTTVLDVVKMGSYGRVGWIKRPGKDEFYRAMEALEKIGIHNLADRQISQLSGGQQQRVFLARALVQNADLYLMDEPFQGVDAQTERAIITMLKELREQGKTVVVVHHDLQTVPEYFDWVVLLNVRLVESGFVKDVFTQENLKKTYGGRIGFLKEAEVS